MVVGRTLRMNEYKWWGCCPLPLPLTDGGAKTKQPSRLLSPVPGEASPPASKEQRGPRLIQPGARLASSRARKAEAGNNAGVG